MSDKPFVNLHTHSHYSVLESLFTPRDIIASAKKMGCDAVALTDRGVGYGLIDFVESAKDSDIKTILGAEVAVSMESRWEKRPGIDGDERSVVFLATNETGYKNLLKILSKSYLEGFFEKPRADLELLREFSEGLIALTGSWDGFLGQEIIDGQNKKAEEKMKILQEIFGENLYLEMVGRNIAEQKKVNQWMLEKHEKSGIPVVITSDARYPTPEEAEATNVLLAISRGNILSRQDENDSPVRDNWFRSWKELCDALPYVPEEIKELARKNTLSIAEKINFSPEFGVYRLPKFEVPAEETEKNFLRLQCEKGIEKLFKPHDPELPEVRERLDFELGVISKMGFDAYFLIVADFIHFAKENGIAVGPGRGSAPGSIVSYLLGITTIDPIKYELLFERFLNPARVTMPDIDIDFSDERRGEVVEYVTKKYGKDRVSKVCTFGTMAAKAAIKDVGRAYGIPFTQMNTLTKLLPNRPGFTLDEAEKIKEFTDFLEKNPQLKKIFLIAKKLEGCVRHVSVHACAVIIGGQDLTEVTPVQWAPGTNDEKITQLPYQQLEHLGLLKMDFLGLKNLSIIEKTLKNIKKNNPNSEEIDLQKIPLRDPETFAMLARGETTGVFQFESAGMRRYLKDLKPTEFEDLVAMNALYRPGPMKYIPQYIEGKNDPKTVSYLHPVLEPILKKTHGIAVYQEQVLRIARDFAGFSLGEADILRRAIGKKIAQELASQREKFITGATEKGHQKDMAEKIFDEVVVPFSDYGFNRSHSLCYARIAYETAYLRSHYPEAFMTAMMTTDRNDTDRIVLEMNECKEMEIEVLPPMVNDSDSFFTLTEEGGEKKIRFGLTAIKGLGEETARHIIVERDKNGPYTDLADFARRLPTKLMNKKTLEALTYSGAFDGFGDRKAISVSIEDISHFAREEEIKKNAGQIDLFDGLENEKASLDLPDIKAEKSEILKWEKQSLGLYVSDHPLRGLENYFQKYGKPIGKILEEDDGKKITLHGIITSVRKIFTRQGKNMATLVLEDTSGSITCTIFPKTYETINSADLVEDNFIQIKGRLEEREGRVECLVSELEKGDLLAIQKSHLSAEDLAVFSSEVNTNELLEIEIPEKFPAEKAEKIKKILAENRVSDDQGRPVSIQIHGKIIRIPFLISGSPALEREITEILPLKKSEEKPVKTKNMAEKKSELTSESEGDVIYF